MARGAVIGPSVKRRPGAADALPQRIAIAGTGGVSHWPATPESGEINAPRDGAFLAWSPLHDKTALLRCCDDECYREGGQGAFEIRTFIAIVATTRGAGTVRQSQPIPISAVNCTIGVMDIV